MTKIKLVLTRFIQFFFISSIIGILIILAVPYLNSSCSKKSNINKFDVIIVLGSPATDDCKPGFIMKDRVDKGIELFKLGMGKKILFTGSSVRNNCTEAEVMATYAISKGVSKTNILKETRAENTFQNAFYSVEQLKELNFKSAAIVTSEPHIKRSCEVFAMFNINYSMFPSKNPDNISKLQLLFWKFGERMILTHHIIFGYPETSSI